MTNRIAILAGSTGLIGKQLLDLLLAGDNYSSVIAISRKPLNLDNPKLTNVVTDDVSLAQHFSELKGDDVFCCLGTTIKQAKTKEVFRRIDLEYPLALAEMTKKQNAKQFLLVSSLGADKASSIFYNQVKGETEEAIRKVGFESLHIFRPSMLLGDRKEHRAGEQAAKVVFKFFGFLIPKKYKGIDSAKVARAMKVLALENKKGLFVYESQDLQVF